MASRAVSVGLLLPPSEGKASGGSGPLWSPSSGRFDQLGRHRAKLVKALVAAKGGDHHLLGVGGKHLVAAQAANRGLKAAASLPAWHRYTGVVWEALDVASLTRTATSEAMQSVVVVSGLLGIVGLDDPTPDYRLKAGASLPPFGKLSTWWRPIVGDALTVWGTDRFVVDLLPNEHRSMCTAATLQGVSVSFVERDGKVAGHFAKVAKGRLARHVLTSRRHPLRALESWTDDRFDLIITPIGG
jgi:uncharacterized protein